MNSKYCWCWYLKELINEKEREIEDQMGIKKKDKYVSEGVSEWVNVDSVIRKN